MDRIQLHRCVHIRRCLLASIQSICNACLTEAERFGQGQMRSGKQCWQCLQAPAGTFLTSSSNFVGLLDRCCIPEHQIFYVDYLDFQWLESLFSSWNVSVEFSRHLWWQETDFALTEQSHLETLGPTSKVRPCSSPQHPLLRRPTEGWENRIPNEAARGRVAQLPCFQKMQL